MILPPHVADLPSYGYRRACALVNRQRRAEGRPAVNPKRAYCVMAQAKPLLPKAPRRPQSSRKHEGKVVVTASDTRWCSDGFAIKCDSGEPVREMLIEAVEKRFGAVEAIPDGLQLEFLTDVTGPCKLPKSGH